MSKKGTSTLIMQRASAVVMIPFIGWFLWSLAAHAGDSYTEMVTWLRAPLAKVMFGGLVTIGAFHMRIGLGEVIDDYLQGGLRTLSSLLNLLAAISVVAATWFSLYNI